MCTVSSLRPRVPMTSILSPKELEISTDWDEFRTASIFTKQVEKAFGAYRQFAGGVPEREAYDQLSRIWVNSSGYRNLRDQIEDHAFYIVDGESAGVVETLAQFGLESAVRNAELNALDIWNHLESIGYKRRHWDTDPRVLSSVQEANRRYIDSFKRQSIHGNSMPRDEVSTAEGLLTSAKESVSVLVTGEAGVGKSGVMFQVVEGLMAAGFPVLALRADWLNSTQLADDVGAQCGLLGSPPRVLAAVAQKKSCVLVIDQLDAVSMASGRNSALYECMNDILLQALSYDNMNILLACRKFDLDHDNRLRRLASQGTDSTTVTVNRLSEERVLEVVKSLGIDADRLTEGQLSLLSVPLHLWLLSDLVQDEEVSALNFESANDLYERFWLFKQRILGERLGRQIHWTQVIGTLCDYMHEYQVLTAPQDLVDEWDADATAMSSENVLVLDGLRYSFFHEGFFDYCYARSFSRRGESLLGLLTQDEQGLFRRAQVRQILLYLREADFDRYAGDLRDVLHSDDVRFHIKQAVLAVLSGLSEPSEREWEVLSEFRMEDYSNPASRQVWAIIRRSGSWFRLVDSLGLVEQWLESTDEEFVDRAVWLLSGAQPRDSDRVTALLTPRVGGSERWNSRLQELARSTDWTAGRPYFDLMISLIDQGVLDDVDGSQASIAGLSSFLGYWSKSKPAWGCEVIGHYLARRRELSVQAGEPNPFDLSSGTVPLHDFPRDIISVCADGAPQAFVCEVLPFVQKTVEDTAGGELEGLRLDKVWSRRAFPEGYNAASTLLGALASALSVLAVQEPDEFKNLIGPLLQSEFETLQYLVIRGMASNGEQFADEGLMHLCERPERFNVGSLSDRRWTVRRLIEAAGPYASSDPFAGIGEGIAGVLSGMGAKR